MAVTFLLKKDLDGKLVFKLCLVTRRTEAQVLMYRQCFFRTRPQRYKKPHSYNPRLGSLEW